MDIYQLLCKEEEKKRSYYGYKVLSSVVDEGKSAERTRQSKNVGSGCEARGQIRMYFFTPLEVAKVTFSNRKEKEKKKRRRHKRMVVNTQTQVASETPIDPSSSTVSARTVSQLTSVG